MLWYKIINILKQFLLYKVEPTMLITFHSDNKTISNMQNRCNAIIKARDLD